MKEIIKLKIKHSKYWYFVSVKVLWKIIKPEFPKAILPRKFEPQFKGFRRALGG